MSNRIAVYEGYETPGFGGFGRHHRRRHRKGHCKYGRKKTGRHGCLKHPRKRR
jgi:hypothetical protein